MYPPDMNIGSNSNVGQAEIDPRTATSAKNAATTVHTA
jgi:hypothetical protein